MGSAYEESELSSRWRPLTTDYLLTEHKLTEFKILLFFAGWFLIVLSSFYLSAMITQHEWFAISIGSLALTDLFIFNPVFILGILLLYWFGFEWGFLPVYLNTFVVAYLSGIPILWSSLIGLSFVLGMGFYALAYHCIHIDYNLRNLKSITFFIVVTFLASFASSMSSFVWGFFHELTTQQTLVIWKSWWTGIFFQTLLIGGSFIFLFSPVIERVKDKYFTLPPEKKVSVKWIYGSVVSVAITLSIFIFSGYTLGRLNILDIVRNYDIVPSVDLLGSIEAFEVIVWTSLGLITVTASTAIYLLNNWNSSLQKKVDDRTKDLQESQENLKQSLAEKEVLFKEIQHRVKNNLAQVHGLLELQEIMSENEELSNLLKISQTRISTMSMAHDALYNTPDFSNISLKDYLENIATATHKSFLSSEKDIELYYKIEDMRIDMAKAIPFGLMVSEILINAHKHAFNKKNDGEISIITVISDDTITLNIRDNGSGISKDKYVKKSSSLGMILVKNFTDQLDATMKIDTGKNGTSFRFVIPLKSIITDVSKED